MALSQVGLERLNTATTDKIGKNKNKIINGQMICSQRGSSFTSDGYTLDRFERQQSSDGAFTVTQSTTSPDDFANSLKVDVTTADTSLAAAQYAQIKYKIEAQDLQDLAFGTSAAKTVTLSFYVRSNKTGNYAFAIQQSDNSFKQASFQYAISSADTWERKTITIAGDTSGVINNDTGDGFILLWALAAGTNLTSGSTRSTFTTRVAADQYAGQGVNLLDSTSNEWYITGVQLEVGSVATDFEHRSFAQELELCKRYYLRLTRGGSNTMLFTGCTKADTYICFSRIELPVTMRTVPSISFTGTRNIRNYSNDNSGFSGETISENSFLIRWGSSTGITDGAAYTAELTGNPNFVEVSAEL
tara:strand:- start:357 stop:1433 length:1077 start_codon:yes stop_codon:yes gene_type:complete